MLAERTPRKREVIGSRPVRGVDCPVRRNDRGRSSIGRALACHAGGCGFDSRRSLRREQRLLEALVSSETT